LLIGLRNSRGGTGEEHDPMKRGSKDEPYFLGFLSKQVKEEKASSPEPSAPI
jgi:hypothetical protein